MHRTLRKLSLQSAKFDFRSDLPVPSPVFKAEHDSILLFDGICLLRPELIDYWDLTIFIMTDFDITIKRAAIRDQYLFGSEEKVRERYLKRYIPGQLIYLQEAKPLTKANIIVDNNDHDNPEIKINVDEKSQ